eukprot:scaffold9937_cov59-Cylindrotheca_fusiformis.AAC.1
MDDGANEKLRELRNFAADAPPVYRDMVPLTYGLSLQESKVTKKRKSTRQTSIQNKKRTSNQNKKRTSNQNKKR